MSHRRDGVHAYSGVPERIDRANPVSDFFGVMKIFGEVLGLGEPNLARQNGYNPAPRQDRREY